MRRHMITANAQNLGVKLLEPAIDTPERDRLLGSATGKIEHVKRKNHMFLPAVLTQRHIAIIRRREGKISRLFANISYHDVSFPL